MPIRKFRRSLSGAAALVVTAALLYAAQSFSVSTNNIDFGNVAPNATIAPKTFRVNNNGNASGSFSLSITFDQGGNWLTFSPSSGTIAAGGFATITVSPKSGLGNGTYGATLTLRDTTGGGNVFIDTVNIGLGVSGALLVLSTNNVSITIPAGAPSAQGTFTASLQGGGSADLIATPSGGSWLGVSPLTAVNTVQQVFTITATKSLISGSSASGSVRISCQNGSPCTALTATINVTVTPTVTLNDPGGLSIDGASGGAAITRSLTIGASDGSTLSYTISVPQGSAWLSATSSSGSTSSPLVIKADPKSLAGGTYSGQVRLTPSNGTSAVNINVTFNVATGALTLSNTSIAFTAQAGTSGCGNRTISVSAGGPGVPYTVKSAVATPAGGTWLTSTPDQAVTPSAATAYCDAKNLTAGTYTGSITLTSGAPNTQPVSVPVTLTVSSGQPAIAVVSAASGATQLAPAMIASLYGTGLADSLDLATSTTLPTTLASRSVTVKDALNATRTAGLFFVSSGQINLEIPAGTAKGTATFSVMNGSTTVVSGTAEIGAVAPGLFVQPGGPAAALAARYFPDGTNVPVPVFSCNATTCVATPIDVTGTGVVYLSLYGTGIRGNSSLDAVKCIIGGRTLPVAFAGDQRTFPGLDQVNVALPASLAGLGLVDMQLTVDGVTSAKVKIAIQ